MNQNDLPYPANKQEPDVPAADALGSCPTCGAALTEALRFCRVCGSVLEWEKDQKSGKKTLKRKTPDSACMSGVYAGPEQSSSGIGAFQPTQEQQTQSDPLRNLKQNIIDTGRLRMQYYTFQQLDGRSEEDLCALLDALNKMPVTMFEDRMLQTDLPPSINPSMMMTYAGPKKPLDGIGFIGMNGMLNQQPPQPAPETPAPEDAKPIGFCSECGNPLYARSKFCPECGARLKYLK